MINRAILEDICPAGRGMCWNGQEKVHDYKGLKIYAGTYTNYDGPGSKWMRDERRKLIAHTIAGAFAQQTWDKKNCEEKKDPDSPIGGWYPYCNVG